MELDSTALCETKYLERMQRLLSNETKIEVRETTLCRKSAKIHQKYIIAMESFLKEKQELQKLTKVVKKRSQELEERTSFSCHIQKALDATKDRIANKKDLLKQNKSTVRENNNVITECMHKLKEVTGTYINHEALPGREKGVIVVQDKWIPFNYPAGSINGLGKLWQNVHGPSNRNADKWQKLLSTTIKMEPTEDKTESSRKANMAVTSIVEIDLTSPTNTRHNDFTTLSCLGRSPVQGDKESH